MATTRLSLPAVEHDARRYRYFCPTCRRTSARDGRHGWRNRPFSCSPMCQRRFVAYDYPRRLFNISAATVFDNYSFHPPEAT